MTTPEKQPAAQVEPGRVLTPQERYERDVQSTPSDRPESGRVLSPCLRVEVEGYGMDRTDCRTDDHRDYCENRACCSERGHEGKCDERAGL